MVLATQNPIDFVGTYPLPEAQMDRFFLRIAIGYPSIEEEMDVLERYSGQRRIAAQGAAARVRRAGDHRMQEMVGADIRQPRGAQLCGHHRRANAGSTLPCSWACRRAAPSRWCGRPRPARCWPGATTCCPMTCGTWRCSVLSHRLMLTPEARMKDYSAQNMLKQLLDVPACARQAGQVTSQVLRQLPRRADDHRWLCALSLGGRVFYLLSLIAGLMLVYSASQRADDARDVPSHPASRYAQGGARGGGPFAGCAAQRQPAACGGV
jgi:hypothetical protein